MCGFVGEGEVDPHPIATRKTILHTPIAVFRPHFRISDHLVNSVRPFLKRPFVHMLVPERYAINFLKRSTVEISILTEQKKDVKYSYYMQLYN
ncbi:hypothetical protein DNHGIG_19510 [Collibacillus ludicampi]|uniref:Uncharacterized protein n=1 Tax=Collibacillus ludicampi TaxID=2771369 RepID=A0AAV4LEZ8_9BACL|nr:hypothetical protein DNHGIG_19510 [Collibacillus ludicampi]